MFSKLPRSIAKALMIVRLLSPLKYMKLAQCILYLWREFYVKTTIEIKVSTIKVTFSKGNDKILTCSPDRIEEIISIIEDIKKGTGNK